MPAKNMLNRVTTWARPPRKWPTRVCASRDHALGDVGRGHQLADQQEERHGQQRLGVDAVEHLADHRLQADRREARSPTITPAISAKATGTPM